MGGRSWFSGLWSPPKMVASNPLTNPLWEAVLNCTGRCPLSIMQSSLMYKYNLCVERSNSYISANQQQRESKWSRWVQVLITCGTVCSLNERLRRVPLKFEILFNKEQVIFKIKGMLDSAAKIKLNGRMKSFIESLYPYQYTGLISIGLIWYDRIYYHDI